MAAERLKGVTSFIVLETRDITENIIAEECQMRIDVVIVETHGENEALEILNAKAMNSSFESRSAVKTNVLNIPQQIRERGKK